MKILWLTALVVILDQVTKTWVRTHMALYESIPDVRDGWFKLTYTENPGIAFGLDFGFKPVLTLFTLGAVVGLVVLLSRLRAGTLWTRIPLALILGGAAGNLIDRVYYGVLFQDMPWLQGRVVDFLHVDWPGQVFGWDSFPIFNLADSAIVVGVGIILMFNNRVFPPPTEPVLAPEAAAPAVPEVGTAGAASRSEASLS